METISRFQIGRLCVLSAFSIALPVCGQIVNTLTSANMSIKTNGTPQAILATMTDTDPFFSQVEVSYLPWDASAYSWFKMSFLDPESARINFSVGMGASDGSGYMGEDTLGQNHVFLHYHADVDSELSFSYVLDYTYRFAMELGALNITLREGYVDGSPSIYLPWKSILWTGLGLTFKTHYEGSGVYPLEGGKDYTIAVWTDPGGSGQLGALGKTDYSLAEVVLKFRCFVSLQYYAQLASLWLQDGCGEPDWCQGADLNRNGEVDHDDLLEMVEYWLDYCPETW